MGFRSTLAAQDHHGIAWPEWFREKYGQWLDADGRLSVAQERKVYSSPVGYVYVWLHECAGVTLVQVDRDRITILEPTGWEPVEYPDPPDGQAGSHETWHNGHHDYAAWLTVPTEHSSASRS